MAPSLTLAFPACAIDKRWSCYGSLARFGVPNTQLQTSIRYGSLALLVFPAFSIDTARGGCTVCLGSFVGPGAQGLVLALSCPIWEQGWGCRGPLCTCDLLGSVPSLWQVYQVGFQPYNGTGGSNSTGQP